MENLLTDLRRFYFRTFLPSIIIFIVCFLATRLLGSQPMVTVKTASYIMVALLAATFIVFIVTWFILRNARAKVTTMEGDGKYDAFAKAYKARILSMSIVAVLSSACYVFTVDPNAIYLVVIALLLVLLYYPSENFVGRQVGEDKEQ